MPGGRPLKFKTPEALRKKVKAYFKKADFNKEPYQIIDLAHFLGTNRTTLMEYEGLIEGREKGKDKETQQEFANIIKEAKEKCAAYLIKKGLTNEHNTAMSIFLLKANHKLRDKDPDVPAAKITINNLNDKEEVELQKVLDNEYGE